ncbi:DUF3545 family protein [Echinimonas agarilytica]|uniref:DUF3545 family protein n=1 Tax=Echinimonas agarilytica TaxID=1215918 RepID=A0AA41WBK5_9GAMM|nr:DUF3545 family protein [Echinimonas agarilytica]MCM2681348.1 DUF3545 family protein [Echinimonas agarilytica]
MERLEFGYSDSSYDKSNERNSRSKRKWREIESIKEKYRLQKELDEFDFSFSDGLDER